MQPYTLQSCQKQGDKPGVKIYNQVKGIAQKDWSDFEPIPTISL